MFEKLERGLFMCFLFAIVGVTGIFWKRIWDLREEQIQFLRLAEEVKTVRDETEVMEYAFRGEKDMLPEYKGLWEKTGIWQAGFPLTGQELTIRSCGRRMIRNIISTEISREKNHMEERRLRQAPVLIWEGKGVYFCMAIICVMEACLRIC